MSTQFASTPEADSTERAAGSRLRSRFVFWGLAVVGSLSTSGLVSRPNPVWAQETAEEASSGASAEANTVEETEKPQLTSAQVNDLFRKRQTEELSVLLDEALAEDALNANYLSWNLTLGRLLLREDENRAIERIQKQYETLFSAEDMSRSQLSMLGSTAEFLMQFSSETPIEEKRAMADAVLAKLLEDDSLTAVQDRLQTSLARTLVVAEQTDDAKSIMDGIASILEAELEDGGDSARKRYLQFVASYHSTLAMAFPEAAEGLMSKALTLAEHPLDGDEPTVGDFASYYQLLSRVISMNLYADPKLADQYLTGLEARLERLTEHLGDDGQTQLRSYASTLSSMRSRLASSLERELLIGTDAAEIDADAFVAMDPVAMDDLKGKVVLIDFWAVWCGPCIATFPHLIEWHEQYADKGLVILGATKYYNYAWNDESGRASRSQEEVSHEDELVMLERFRESHGLHHGFFVAPDDSEYSKQFKVSGIPQAVLIDKEGKIAMIRVGSGEANATALHDKIEELLGQ